MKKTVRSLLLISALLIMLTAFSFLISAADFPATEITDIISTDTTVTLTWDKIEGADGYHLQKRDEDGYFRMITNTRKTTYTVKNLSPDTEYDFRVRPFVYREDRTKDYGPFCTVTSKLTKLSAPVNLRSENETTTALTVKWDTVENATYYKVYYGIVGKSGYTFAGYAKKATSFTLENLSGLYRYKVRVVARRSGNTSAYSESAIFYTVAEKGKTPTLRSKDGGSVTIQWTRTGRENFYNVYVAEKADGEYKKIATTNKRYYKYEAATPEKAYYFKVAPVIETKLQLLEGEPSDYLRASVGSISIKCPSVIRKGDYPEITVPYYDSDIKWTSSNSSVITLKNSRLFAAGKGTATLTATYKNKYTAKVKVTVSSAPVSCMAAVYDVTDDKYIFEQNINKRCYPASITKLITALVALEHMDPNDTIVVGSELNMVEYMCSVCGIRSGEKYRLKDLLYGLLLPSGGDAAYTIAVNCARKVSGNPNMSYTNAKKYFAGLMNDYMKSIGATGTNCVNPHGYPVSSHYSTVHDLMLVANKVHDNELLQTITSTKNKYITALTGQGHSWRTTNSLLTTSSAYYSPYAHGMKTGTVNESYTGIISAATKNGKTIITIVIGCPTYNSRYENTHKLLKAYL